MALFNVGRSMAALLRLGALVLLAAISVTSASAAGLLQTANSNDLRAAIGTGSTLGALVKRSRIAMLNVGELAHHVAPLNMDTAPNRISAAVALDGVIIIELFPDVVATFKRRSVDEIGDSGYAWVGEVDRNPLYYASLIVDEGQVTGHIQLMDRLFQIEPMGSGLHRVIELKSAAFPPDDPGQQHSGAAPTKPEPAAVWPASHTQIRVLVAYTKQAAIDAGGKAAIKNQIKQAVSLANIGYTNSNIPMTIVLAQIMSAGSYVEQANIADDLNNLDGNNGSPLSNVRDQRAPAAADLVSLFRKTAGNTCGIGNLTDNPSADTSNVAFHVMNWLCVSNLSFHHEMGHNMGLRHDRFVDPSVGVGYNHGYVNKTTGCHIRSVMAYNDDCANSGFNCTRVNYFSTQAFKLPVMSGVTTKKCQIGVAKGKTNASDNAQRLWETRVTISGYEAGADVSADAR
jgi:hypothetical protein